MSTESIARYCLEDLHIGQSAEYARTVTEADIQKFGEVSGDMNPLHFDEAYARGTIFRGRIAHGILTVSYLSTILGTKLPGAGSIFLGASVRFKAPVRIGDTVTATVTVREVVVGKRRCVLDSVCTVNGKVVIEGESTMYCTTETA